MEQNERKEIGKRIFAKRKEAKLTRAELGMKLGLHESTVKRYEDGDIKSVDIERLKEFAQALHINVSFLMGMQWDTIPMDLSDQEASVINAYRENPEKQHAVNAYLGVWDNVADKHADIHTLEQYTLWDQYMALDDYGKDMVRMILEKELLRTKQQTETVFYSIPYAYDLPASAGCGEYAMDIAHFQTVMLTQKPPKGADFLVKVSGDSMEPKFSDGDFVFIQRTNSVVPGEIGLFLLDGNIFIKKLGQQELISLNPNYSPIVPDAMSTVTCFGKVIGICEEQIQK